MSPRDRADFHPLDIALVGVQLAQLAIGVLGVLVITGEYSTGMIRASFTAVPKRLPVLWAKAVVFAAVTFALMLPVGADRVLREPVDPVAPPHPRDLVLPSRRRACGDRRRALPAVVGIFALGLGAIIRNTAGGIAAFAAIFFVLPPLMNVLPASWNDAISPYLPSEAGRQIFSLTHDAHSVSPLPGAVLFAGYCALVLGLAAVLLVRRDT